jgi:sulfite reductase (NADPH) flavoprotein alpha-component
MASVKERYLLTHSDSKKETWHVVLDLHGSGLDYEVGDCVGVFPTNSPEVVNRTLEALGHASGRLRAFLERRANLTSMTSRILRLFAERQPDLAKRCELEKLLQSRDRLKEYLNQRELWDLLIDHPEVRLGEEELYELLQPLLPRFYSIASAQEVVGEEVHLTVRHVAYTSREVEREGVCTDFLCYRSIVGESVVPLFIQKSTHFRLPRDPQIPIIMVGPGTGVAPFRAFLQLRHQSGAAGANWLFFGEWTRDHDFYYRDYWKSLTQEGFLRLETAFSRDQESKVYVQHRMLEHAPTLWEWLQRGAYFYVCGDASRMARDVEATLQLIAQQEGKLSVQEARGYIRQLRRDRRYLADVY